MSPPARSARGRRLERLPDRAQIYLENLHPEHPRLSTRLPGLRPQAFVERAGVPGQEVEMRLDGLWIDTDRARCAATWRAQVPLTQAKPTAHVLVASH